MTSLKMFRTFLLNKKRWIYNLILFLATVMGGVFNIPDVPGWIFLILLFFLILFLNFTFHILKKENLNLYNYRKLLEETYVKFDPKVENSDDESNIKISSTSKHTYSIIPVKKNLSVIHHEFKIYEYLALRCSHTSKETFIESLNSDYPGTQLNILEFSNNSLRFRLELTPPIDSSKIINYTFIRESTNPTFFSQEDLFEAISNGSLPPSRPFCFRSLKVDVPTDLLKIKVEFPKWYVVKKILPIVLFNGEVINEIQEKLYTKYQDGIETYSYELVVNREHLFVGFYYAISWIPPSLRELKEDNIKKNEQ